MFYRWVEYLDPGKLMRIRIYGSSNKKRMEVEMKNRGPNQGSADPNSGSKSDLDPHLEKLLDPHQKSTDPRILIVGTGIFLPNLIETSWRAAGLIRYLK